MIEKKSNTISSIVFLRGLAALLVCLYHFGNHNDIHGALLQDGTLLKSILKYGKYGVHIFFVISGFVIPYSMWKNKFEWKHSLKYFYKRILRIEPAYLATVVLILCSAFIFTVWNNTDFVLQPKRLLLHIGYLIPFTDYHWYNDIFWTLAIEFQYYIVMILLFPLLIHQNKIIAFATFSLMMVGSLFATDYIYFYYAPIFGFGILYFWYYIKKINPTELTVAVLFISTLLLFSHQYVFLTVSIFSTLMIHFFKWESKYTNGLGEISYSLYLIHGELGGKLIYFMLPVIGTSIELRYLLFIAALLFSILGASLFWKLIELPSKKISHRVKL